MLDLATINEGVSIVELKWGLTADTGSDVQLPISALPHVKMLQQSHMLCPPTGVYLSHEDVAGCQCAGAGVKVLRNVHFSSMGTCHNTQSTIYLHEPIFVCSVIEQRIVNEHKQLLC
jgi:hypothetical protein